MRKTHFLLSITAAVLAFVMSPSLCAYAEQATVTGNEVNVRSGPGTAFSITDSLKRDSVVEVLNRSNADWYQISWDHGSGYVSSAYLQLDGDARTASVSVDQNSSPGYITGNHVCMRSGPGTAYTIIGTYSTGKPLSITGTSGEWIAVSIDGKDGFVFGKYVAEGSPNAAVLGMDSGDPYGGIPMSGSVASSAGTGTSFAVNENRSELPSSGVHSGASSPAEENAGSGVFASSAVSERAASPEPAVPGTGTSAAPEEPSSTATATLAPPASVPAEAGSSAAEPAGKQDEPSSAASAQDGVPGIITGNYVRFRKGPGTTYSIIETFQRGTALTVTGEENGWVSAIIDGITGYVFSDYVQKTEANASSAAETVQQTLGLSSEQLPAAEIRDGYVFGNNVRLREAPSMTAGILTELHNGCALKITGFSGSWTKVICNGQEGFISSDYVREGAFEPTAAVARSLGSEPGKEIASYALTFVGSPYSWGGSSPATGFDCSGFVQYVFSQYGYSTSRVANDVRSDGVHVEPEDIQPGDVLCFYSGNGYVGHVGIYVGDETFVHAANSVSGVVTTSLSSGYYATRGYEIRRII